MAQLGKYEAVDNVNSVDSWCFGPVYMLIGILSSYLAVASQVATAIRSI